MVDQATLLPLPPEGILSLQEKGWETPPVPLSLEMKKLRKSGIYKKR